MREWPAQFRRIGALGFDRVCVAPPFQPGERGDIFLPSEFDQLHPALGWKENAGSGLQFAAEQAGRHGLRLMLDVRLDRLARTATVRHDHPDWFQDGLTTDLPDPRRPPRRLDACYARLQDTAAADGLGTWWSERLRGWLGAGVAGIRWPTPWRVPPAVWRRLTDELHAAQPGVLLLAWTAGIPFDAPPGLAGLDFDRVAAPMASCGPIGPRFIENADALRRLAPLIGWPEASFADRLGASLPPDSDPAPACRQALRVAAALGSGLFVPMGFEYATAVAFDRAEAGPADFSGARERGAADLSQAVVEATQLVDKVAGLGVDGAFRTLTTPGEPGFAFLRADAPDVRDATTVAVVLVDPRNEATRPFPLDELPPQAGAAFGTPAALDERTDPLAALAPREARVLAYRRLRDVRRPADKALPDPATLRAGRLAIEAVAPVYTGRRFPGEGGGRRAGNRVGRHPDRGARRDRGGTSGGARRMSRIGMRCGCTQRATTGGRPPLRHPGSVGSAIRSRPGGIAGRRSATICTPSTKRSRPSDLKSARAAAWSKPRAGGAAADRRRDRCAACAFRSC